MCQLESERAKNQQLEEKIKKKDRFLQQMQAFQKSLYQNIEENQEEIVKVKRQEQLKIEELQLQIERMRKIIIEHEKKQEIFL